MMSNLFNNLAPVIIVGYYEVKLPNTNVQHKLAFSLSLSSHGFCGWMLELKNNVSIFYTVHFDFNNGIVLLPAI